MSDAGTVIEEVPATLSFGATGEDPVERIGRIAREALTHKDCREAVGVMIAARQLYALAFEAAQAALPEEDSVAVSEVFAASTADAAAKPFEPAALFQALSDSVVPWVGAVTQRRQTKIADERQRLVEEYEAERRQTPVAFPGTGFQLDRARPQIICGTASALQLFFDLLCAAAVTADQHVIRLSGYEDRKPVAPDASYNYVRLSPREWVAAGRSKDAWLRTVGQRVLPRLLNLPDLLVCDDALKFIYREVMALRQPEAIANDTLKRLAEWAQEAGCGLLLGLPTATAIAGERLEKLSELRFAGRADVLAVEVIAGDEDSNDVVVRLGNEAQDTWSVPVATYDAYRPAILLRSV